MQLPRFEIRDFKLDEEKQKYGGVQVKGRGTLIAVDDVQRRGSFIVWLTAKQEHDNDSPSLKMIVLRDGVGTFETFDYLTGEEKAKKVRYHNWQMIGFTPMQKGVLVQEPAK